MSGFDRTISTDIIQRAAEGDLDAMEAIYVCYIDACYRLSYRMIMDPQLAEDACQETFINVMKNIHSYKHEGSFAGWVRRILVNETIRKINKRKDFDTTEPMEVEPEQQTSLFDSNWMSNLMDLEFYLKKLSPDARTVLILHEIEGFRHTEIAKLLDKSESYSKMTLHRAYKLLQAASKKAEVKHAPE